jgi:tRNA 5-methylaminomethyl-2-thiouridine biosynthesis bifunctional protein
MSDDTLPTAAADVASDASPQLLWAEDGSPRSGRFGDVYFSKDDGLAETRAVFLQGCGLPEAWQSRPIFTVAELGFGTGLNIIALIEMWRRQGPAEGWLSVFSVEGFPLTRDEAHRALAAWPDVAETARALLDQWPSGVPGFHRISLPQWRVTIDLAVGDVDWALDQWAGQADAWFLDGFSPALNPGMWSPKVMARIGARSAPAARVATFTVAGLVRRGLADQGFAVEKKPGFGRKRERLEAYLPAPTEPLAKAPTVAVIGGGIAGASLTLALNRGRAKVILIEAEQPGAGGSGFPAALVTPRLDAGDGVIADIHAQALRHAQQAYGTVEGAILQQGVLQLEQIARDSARFDKIALQDLWPLGQMQRLTPEQVSEALGETVTPGALEMKGAFALHPAAVLDDWLSPARHIRACVAELAPKDGQWALMDEQGETLALVDQVVVAAGWGTASLLPQLPLNPVGGQADWVAGPTLRPTAWGGYAVPTKDGLLYGATHERGVTAPEVTTEASQTNLVTLAKALPKLAETIPACGPAQARVAVRATTPDRLPISGPVGDQPGLYVLSGLGSRAFCVAPLLAEDIASQILNRPSPLPRASRERLSPARFAPRPV